MSVLSDIGNGIITGLTGQNPTQIQQDVQALQVAVGTIIALEAIIALELLVLVAMGWKERH